jgi:hypothetical protein
VPGKKIFQLLKSFLPFLIIQLNDTVFLNDGQWFKYYSISLNNTFEDEGYF